MFDILEDYELQVMNLIITIETLPVPLQLSRC